MGEFLYVHCRQTCCSHEAQKVTRKSRTMDSGDTHSAGPTAAAPQRSHFNIFPFVWSVVSNYPASHLASLSVNWIKASFFFFSMGVFLEMHGWVDWLHADVRCVSFQHPRSQKRENLGVDGSRVLAVKGCFFFEENKYNNNNKKRKCAFSLFSFFSVLPSLNWLHILDSHTGERDIPLKKESHCRLQAKSCWSCSPLYYLKAIIAPRPYQHLVPEEENLGDRASVVTRECSKELLEAVQARLQGERWC